MSLPLPVPQCVAGAIGAADTDPITVSGIQTGDVLLAVAQWKAGEAPAGLDVSDFTVGDGTITAATADTTGYYLAVVWSPA